MSFIGDDSGGEDAAARTSSDLRKPFLHTGSWYRMAAMGSRQSSLMDKFSSSAAVIRDSAVSVVLCTLIVALGPVQFGFTCGFSSPTQEDIIRDLGLTLSEVDRAQHCSLFFSINFLFLITNCLICGRERICFSVFGIWIVGERWSYGRRYCKRPDCGVYRAQRDSSFLYLGRLLEGFGVGVISYVVPVYIAEIAPQNMRGALGSVNQLSVTIGVMIAYVLGLFVQWRVLAVLGIVPCLILIPGLFFIPESPRWLAKMGMMEDFETSLQVLRGFDTDITLELNEIKRSVASSSRRTTIHFSDLKKRRYKVPRMIGIGLLVLQLLSGMNAILFYSSNIFKAAGLSSSNIATCGLGVIQVVATGVTTWLMDKAGRRLLLIISSSGMTVSLLLVSIAFYLKDVTSEDSKLYFVLSMLSLVGLVAFVISFCLGLGAIPWIIMSEILPPNIKSLGGSVATLANWLTSWATTMTANLLLSWSNGGTFTIYTVVSAFTVVFVVLCVPETKGRTLEEIQWSFR